jgi:hypothetical protein
MRGRKRAEDATIKFHKNGKVVVSVPNKKPYISRRTDPIGSTAWFMLHILGLTSNDGDTFIITAERTNK